MNAIENFTSCARCGETKPTPIRNDSMGGYVCLLCVDRELIKLQKNSEFWFCGPAVLDALIGSQKALRKALPLLPPDAEAIYCGEWLDEVNEVLSNLGQTENTP